MIVVYKITNPVGQIYVGSSKNYPHRLNYYKTISSRGHTKLYSSIQKWGWNNHIVEVVEECNIENRFEREFFHGMNLNVLSANGLNGSLPKSNGTNALFSEETKVRMKNRKGGYKGYPHSDSSKELLRQAQLGRKHTVEHRNKVSENSAKINSKLVLDIETGIFYDSIKEAAIAKGIVHSSLKNRVNGHSPTYTSIKII